MAISENKIYPRTGDKETVYLKSVVTNPNIIVGDFTIYNDFYNNPQEFEKNNVLYHYPINHDKLIIGKFCSIACGAKFCLTVPIMRRLPYLLIHSLSFLKNGIWRLKMLQLHGIIKEILSLVMTFGLGMKQLLWQALRLEMVQ